MGTVRRTVGKSPDAVTLPLSMTKTVSACCTVERRCATTIERRLPAQLLQALGDDGLGAGVEAAGRLVEHQQARLDVESAGEPDALDLAAAERVGLLADRRVDPVGQRRDELLELREPQHLAHPVAIDVLGLRCPSATFSAMVPETMPGRWGT